jgi:proteasome activator subunit 4
VVNILLYVAEQSKRYYPATEIAAMLSTFMPMLTKDVRSVFCSSIPVAISNIFKQTVLSMVPVITSFIPPTHTHLYLPALFKIWEAFNSSVIDDRLIELVGDLSEEHVAGKSGIAGEEGGAEWKDIGIWTANQWTMLIGKGLGSMSEWFILLRHRA